MRTVLSPKLIRIANNVAKIPFMKSLLKPFYYPYKQRITDNRNKIFLKYGESVLKDFDALMLSHGVNYMMVAGSMLGAVREHGFIKHDFDIDVAIFAKEGPDRVQQILEQNGFALRHSFQLEGGKLAREDTYEKHNVALDIFYVYEDTVQYLCEFKFVEGCTSWIDSMERAGHVLCNRVEVPLSERVIRVPFESIEVNVPENYHEWLSTRYGTDYMTPNPGWHNGSHPCIHEWEGMKPIFMGEI